MNIQETNQLLIRMQVIDNRQIGDSTVLAWHELVADLDYATAVEAVKLHQRESTAYLTPAHVRANVERILLAGVEGREDEFGNELDVDEPALAAHRRLTSARAIGVTS
ncbi:hypothetical protein JNB62_05530 [Microbacterium jejuense]|uniref:Uncharacterized protein n=1 Tax=Microbacterium jejuense TaxID=1263637 RepID=A0ABS7HJK7_9MICO|nr:hypothetical protein [Microbacterium jejuense]MBW9093137.1 hypothetical protein [Microbacterium jejuense]